MTPEELAEKWMKDKFQFACFEPTAYTAITRVMAQAIAEAGGIGFCRGFEAAREQAAQIALAIDSGRGNEKEIAAAIRAMQPEQPGEKR